MSLIERIEGYFAKPAHWHHDNHTEAGALLREALAALKDMEERKRNPCRCQNCLEPVPFESAHMNVSGGKRWSCSAALPSQIDAIERDLE